MSETREPSHPGSEGDPTVSGSVSRASLEVEILTLFPGMFSGPLSESIPGRVQSRGLATIRVHDLREWGLGRHRTVDDYTYGGGAGMVLRPEPVGAALEALRRPDSTVILPDPGGEVFGQVRARDLAGRGHLIILCPRYEGVDDRIRSMVDLELSIGDYVLSGGEIPAMVIVDAILRLLPGAIDTQSTAEESFAEGLLEYPQYTRPPVFGNVAVPVVLTSGHHEAVRTWRLKESLRRTLRRRPELIEHRSLTRMETQLLVEVRGEEAAAAEAVQERSGGGAGETAPAWQSEEG